MHSCFEGFKVQSRVWAALFLREMQTRWGRRNLGFAWLFAEPLVFFFPVMTMWSYMRAPYDNGIPMKDFIWSGYLPLLIFRHVTAVAMYIVRNNGALLYHRVISPFDIFIGRCGMEALGNLAASFASFALLYGMGFLDWPDNIPLMLTGFFYMTWWALAVALLVAALSERSEYVEHIWMPISYLYMAVSGFVFLAAWLPPGLRNVALTIDPPLHAYEMIRDGMYGHLVHTYADPGYLSIILASMTVLGLWLMSHVREHLEIL